MRLGGSAVWKDVIGVGVRVRIRPCIDNRVHVNELQLPVALHFLLLLQSTFLCMRERK